MNSVEVPSLRARQILRALAEVDAEMDVLEAQRAAVLAIHFGTPAVGTSQLFCASCRDKYGGRPTWPCATARAAGVDVPSGPTGMCDSRCPSTLRAGRPDRCGLLSWPPRCQPDHCTASDER